MSDPRKKPDACALHFLRALSAGPLETSRMSGPGYLSYATARALERRGLAIIDLRTTKVSITQAGRDHLAGSR